MKCPSDFQKKLSLMQEYHQTPLFAKKWKLIKNKKCCWHSKHNGTIFLIMSPNLMMEGWNFV